MATRWRRKVSCRSAHRRPTGAGRGSGSARGITVVIAPPPFPAIGGRVGRSAPSPRGHRGTARGRGARPRSPRRAASPRAPAAAGRSSRRAPRPSGRAAGPPRARATPGRGRPSSAARRPRLPRRPPASSSRPARGSPPSRARWIARARFSASVPAKGGMRRPSQVATRTPGSDHETGRPSAATGLAVASRTAVIAATLFPRTSRRTPRWPRSVWQAAHSSLKTSRPAAASSAARSATGRPSNAESPGRQAAGASAQGEVARTPSPIEGVERERVLRRRSLEPGSPRGGGHAHAVHEHVAIDHPRLAQPLAHPLAAAHRHDAEDHQEPGFESPVAAGPQRDEGERGDDEQRRARQAHAGGSAHDGVPGAGGREDAGQDVDRRGRPRAERLGHRDAGAGRGREVPQERERDEDGRRCDPPRRRPARDPRLEIRVLQEGGGEEDVEAGQPDRDRGAQRHHRQVRGVPEGVGDAPGSHPVAGGEHEGEDAGDHGQAGPRGGEVDPADPQVGPSRRGGPSRRSRPSPPRSRWRRTPTRSPTPTRRW